MPSQPVGLLSSPGYDVTSASEPEGAAAQNAPAASNPNSVTAAKLLSGTPVTQNRQPSENQDISSILEPYINEMMQLGPEYQSEMDYLKPYLLGTGAEAPETFKQLESSSAANASPTGNTAVNAADAAVGQEIEGQPAPGFGNVAKAGEEYAATLPYAQPLQAGLGYQKYLQTYGGLQPTTTGWSEQAQQAYAAAMGDQASGSGLQAPTVAAGDATASKNAQQVLSSSNNQAGGNTS